MIKEQVAKIYNQGELLFYWKAYRKDGSILCQFEEIDGEVKENLFTEIDSKPEKFKEFELVNTENPEKTFSVYLDTGDFKLGNVIIRNNINTENYQLKCIFWRKKAITLNISSSKESSKYLYYTLGWQTNIDNMNIKKEYLILPDNSVREVFQKQNKKLYSRARIIN